MDSDLSSGYFEQLVPEWESQDELEAREIMRKIKWDRPCPGCFAVKLDIWEGPRSFAGSPPSFAIRRKGTTPSDCRPTFAPACFRSRLWRKDVCSHSSISWCGFWARCSVDFVAFLRTGSCSRRLRATVAICLLNFSASLRNKSAQICNKAKATAKTKSKL